MENSSVTDTIKSTTKTSVNLIAEIIDNIKSEFMNGFYMNSYFNDVSETMKQMLNFYTSCFKYSFNKLMNSDNPTKSPSSDLFSLSILQTYFPMILVAFLGFYTLYIMLTSLNSKRRLIVKIPIIVLFCYVLVIGPLNISVFFQPIGKLLRNLMLSFISNEMLDSMLQFVKGYNILELLIIMFVTLLFFLFYNILKHIPVICILLIEGVKIFDRNSDIFGIVYILFVVLSFSIYLLIQMIYRDVIIQVSYSLLSSLSILIHYVLISNRNQNATESTNIFDSFFKSYFSLFRSEFTYIFLLLFIVTMYNQKQRSKVEEKSVEEIVEPKVKHKKKRSESKISE